MSYFLFLRNVTRFPAFCLVALLSAGCAASVLPASHAVQSETQEELLRPHPGYVQWLEKQSILNQSDELIAVVSGTPLVWGASGSSRNLAPLLEAADVWLDFDPSGAVLEGKKGGSSLAALPRTLPPRVLAELGIRGLLLSSVAENAETWNLISPEGTSSAEADAVVGLRMSPSVAAEDAVDEPSPDYRLLEELCARDGLILGGEILPGATGMGPDFRLACMGFSRYADLYMMIEAPRDVWPLLPPAALQPASGESGFGQDVAALTPEVTAALVGRGILPPPFSRDRQTFLPPGGWAATSPWKGRDGVTRRWLYRYAESPRILPLHWDAPRASARKALSASIIRQAGLLHQPLLRVRLGDMAGLEPAVPGHFSREPAWIALNALSRDIRRYGGWSLLGDLVPPSLLTDVQELGVDFVPDSVTSPALEFALLTGDTTPLRRNLDDSFKSGVDHARLWRSTPTRALPLGSRWLRLESDSVRKELETISPLWAARTLKLAPSGPMLLASAPSVAAAAAARVQDTAPGSSAPVNIHLLQVAFRAFLPGILTLSGNDLSGTVQERPIADADAEALPSAWNIHGGHGFSSGGLPAGSSYPPLTVQQSMPDSFASRLKELLRLRRECGIARGIFLGRAETGEGEDSGGTVACVSRLPDNSMLLVAGNFSPVSHFSPLRLPEGTEALRAEDMISGRGVAVGGRNLRLQMAPWGFRVVRLFAH